MDEAVALLEDVSSCVAHCSLVLVSLQRRLPDLELALSSIERARLQRSEIEWREHAAASVETELAQISARLEQRYRDALQAAFDEQMKRFRVTIFILILFI